MTTLKKGILWLLLLAATAAFGKERVPSLRALHSFAGPDTSGRAVLRVMTYNIHHANPPSKAEEGVIDLQAVAAVINKAKPDLVALQEVDVHTGRSGTELNEARELAKLTGMHYYFSHSIDYQGGEYGNAILSRFPVLDTLHYALPPKKELGGEIRSVGIVKVRLPDKREIYFGSTHLDVSRNEASKLQQAAKIITAARSLSLPLILGGDFNAHPDSRTIALLDTYFTRTCTEDCPLTIPTVNPRSTIDYIMYAPRGRFQPLSVRTIPETYASDHLPVVVELKIQ